MIRASVACIAATCCFAACAQPSRPELSVVASSSAVRVRAVRIRRDDISGGSALLGTLVPMQRAVLSARVAGDLSSVTVDRGDRVHAGQLLASVRVPGLPQQREIAAAARSVAQTELAAERDNATRTQRVASDNAAAIASQDVSRASQRVATAAARVRAADSEIARVNALGMDARIVAPFDGVVVARFADPGTSVAPATRIVEIAQVDRLRLVVDVPERDVRMVSVGTGVSVTIAALGERTLEAAVSRFAPAVDPTSRMLRVEIDVQNDGALLAGLEARVRFRDAARHGVLLAPPDAVIPEREATVLYVLDGEVARRRVVRLGYDDGARVEVLSGVSAGEDVLVGGRGLLEDGARVEVSR